MFISGLFLKTQKDFGLTQHPDLFQAIQPFQTATDSLQGQSYKQNNVVKSIYYSKDCDKQYIWETKQPLHSRLHQHRRTNSSASDFTVNLWDKNYFFVGSENYHSQREIWFKYNVFKRTNLPLTEIVGSLQSSTHLQSSHQTN